MTSKRHVRRRACGSKVRHSTQQTASQHAYKLGPGYHTYKCKWCGYYHVGRQTRASRTVRFAKGYLRFLTKRLANNKD